MKSNNIFIPNKRLPISEDNVWKWYLNIHHELEQSSLSSDEKAIFLGYYQKAGLLRAWRNPFFRHHYSRMLTISINYLFSDKISHRILDLGCGTGTQSLLFSFLGADVIGIDIDEKSLKILEKRKIFYEEISRKKLNLQVYRSNVFEFDYSSILPINGIYSLFAFNMMQPSEKLLDILNPHLSDNCYLAFQDGNKNMWFNRLFRPRPVLSKEELHLELNKKGFHFIKSIGGYAIPSLFWQLLPDRLLRRVDTFLTKFEIFSGSYLHIAKFQG